jgi:hypothetical protein
MMAGPRWVARLQEEDSRLGSAGRQQVGEARAGGSGGAVDQARRLADDGRWLTLLGTLTGGKRSFEGQHGSSNLERVYVVRETHLGRVLAGDGDPLALTL